ncbi:MAG TPA: 6-phosphogluconolactonase, partial [Acidimicrobiales bacterium]|nr:6-phosphogluconolactonase [Acidimicrobiales bacterium]
MDHELVVLDDADAVAREGAARFVRAIGDAIALKGRCAMAVSGGRTPAATFEVLAREHVEWDLVTIFQVDERVAPDGDPDRNLTHLRAALDGLPARVVAMDVTA